MVATVRHREVEAAFRALLVDGDLPPPDDVGYEDESVVFYWRDQRLAIFVDFDEELG